MVSGLGPFGVGLALDKRIDDRLAWIARKVGRVARRSANLLDSCAGRNHSTHQAAGLHWAKENRSEILGEGAATDVACSSYNVGPGFCV
jgi:hypothetical protein